MKNERFLYSLESPEMRPSIVCFVDILGFKDLSRKAFDSGNGNVLLNQLSKSLSKAYGRIKEHSSLWSESKSFDIKIFTDNIVVGYPISSSNAGGYELERIFSIFSEFQIALVMEGFLVRGGIAFGGHYMNDDIVFGDALLDAVKQDKTGGVPSISLASSVVDRLQRSGESYNDLSMYSPFHDLLEDSDGSIYLNYLNQAFIGYPEGGIFFDVIENHKKTIETGLSEHSTTPSILSKYEWAAVYHNFVCEEFIRNNPPMINHNADPEDVAAAMEVQKLKNYTIKFSKSLLETLAKTPDSHPKIIFSKF